MNKFLIIADDFTGANDTGVKLTEKGTPVEVVFSALNLNPSSSCVVDTETRNDAKNVAYGKVKDIINTINLDDYDIIYKKVDSTLRGNISDELMALTESYDPDYIVFDPALPSLEREVVNGNLLVSGEHLKKTEFAHDPLKPIENENIKKIFEQIYPTGLIRLYTLNELRNKELVLDLSKRYFCFDTENDTDMARVVHLFSGLKGKILWVGSSGLIEELINSQNEYNPSIALVGSVSEKTREQLKCAEKNGLSLVSLPIYQIYSSGDYSRYVKQITNLLKQHKDVIIMSSASYDRNELHKTRRLFKKDGICDEQLGSIVQTVLAGVCRKVISQQKVSGIFVTGGATAKGLLSMVNAEKTIVKEEVALGMPLLQIEGGEFNGINIISKAGAFGDSSLLVFALKKLHSYEKR
ncbi:four-carbon acid sugar kinase family protein [Lactobacillus crispatus]|uniref:Four-carbon acid sugar kinase family protein n=1 Tax=Lactobacillus crispatus TaxID=47770 RepID=A0A7H9E8F0_9LACO|nr:four-carbon acid sugar kinase family protein [Lactobacillus crispatus]QLL73525.1 hypothetical protein GTO85_03645 [Lactobacillus crispatus]